MPTNVRLLTATSFLAVAMAAGTGCGRAGGTPDRGPSPAAGDQAPTVRLSAETIRSADAQPASIVERLERLRAAGRFEEFVDGALNAAESRSDDASLLVLQCEALLAAGRPAECEAAAVRAMSLAYEAAEPNVLAQAARLWTTARFRQAKSLDDASALGLLAKLPANDPSVELLSFWRDVLGGRTSYRLHESGDEAVELAPADAAPGSVPFELSAIQARANGATMPLVFIDTGAQHTLMTAEAARSAGVTVGPRGTELVGFAAVTARPGLELGDLVLHDVPVVVGDSAPLVALGGQMSLGTELMHHVRFHIDYPARRITAEPANRAGHAGVHAAGQPHRDPQLHGARTGQTAANRSADRHFLVWRHGLRAVHL